MIASTNSFFGVIDPNVAGYGMNNEPIPYIKVSKGNPLYVEGKQMSPEENRAITGMTLATSIVLPLGAGSVARAGVILGGGAALAGGAEAYKYGTTGEHLTPSEAINTFGMGEVAGLGLLQLNTKVVAPRVQAKVSESYGKTLETGELWKPSLGEKLQMKVTGAKPNAPSLVTKSTDLLNQSYDANAKANVEILKTSGYREVPFGTEPDLEVSLALRQNLLEAQGNPWIPTVKEAEIMSTTGAAPKPLAFGLVSAKGYSGGGAMGFHELKSGIYAEEDFDLAFAPKSSLQTVYERLPLPKADSGLPKRVPTYFGLGQPYQSGYGNKAVLTDFKEVPYPKGREQPLEKGLPENPVEIDSRLSQGPLSFKSLKPTAFEQIKTMKLPGGKMTPKQSQYWRAATTTPKTETGPQVTIQQEKVTLGTQKTQLLETTKTDLVPMSRQSYYPQMTTQLEVQEEDVFLSTPNSGLMHPTQPKYIVDTSQKQNQNSLLSFGQQQRNPVGFNDLLNIGLLDTVIPKTTQLSIPRLDLGQRQKISQEPVLVYGQAPILDVFQRQTPRTTPYNPTPKNILNIPSKVWTPPSLGSKYESGGLGLSNFKVSGLESRKRVWPIFSGEEVLNL
jgi:hypothetical protein